MESVSKVRNAKLVAGITIYHNIKVIPQLKKSAITVTGRKVFSTMTDIGLFVFFGEIVMQNFSEMLVWRRFPIICGNFLVTDRVSGVATFPYFFEI